MLTTLSQADLADIHIEGGLWGFDYGPGGRRTWPGLTVSFAQEPGTSPATSVITIAGGLSLADFAAYTQAIWLYGVAGSANNNLVFAFAPDQTGLASNQIRVLGKVTNEGPIAGFTASVVPPAGGGLRILNSTRGLVRGVKLINTRGVGYFAGGDDFRLLDSSSRDVTPDGGGGVRFIGGTGMLGSRLHIESSDDCFQFNPNDKKGTDLTGATVARSSFVDCIDYTNQGALVAFISGNGGALLPDKQGENNDSLTAIADCSARNIRGATGGSAIHGGVGVKIWCANSSIPITNC